MARLHPCVQWSSRLAASSRVCDASGHCRIGWWRKAAVERLAALGLALVRSGSRLRCIQLHGETPMAKYRKTKHTKPGSTGEVRAQTKTGGQT